MEKDKIIGLLTILAVASVALNLYQYVTRQNGRIDVSYSQSGAATKPTVQLPRKSLQSSSGASITVTSPNGGEAWAYGSTHNITWSASASITNVDISAVAVYSTCTSGTACVPVVNYALAKQVPNNGSYSWVIAIPSGNSYQIWITDSANPATEDISDQTFSITPPPSNASISLSANSASVNAGSAVTLTATITNLPYPVTWFFGDSTGAAEPCTVTFGGTSCTNLTANRTITISHIYNSAGTFEAQVSGSSNGNAILSNSAKVQVK